MQKPQYEKALIRAADRRRGFSMIELLIVVAIMMVVAALALPSLQATVARIRLRGAMSEISGLVQNSRSLAVRRSKTKSVHSELKDGLLVLYTQSCDDANCTGDMAGLIKNEDQVLYLTSGFQIVQKTDVPEEIDQEEIWGNASQPGTKDITFNPRGLPCDLSTQPCGAPKGFIVYLKYAPTNSKPQYIALTVSPAGRIKNYYWATDHWGN